MMDSVHARANNKMPHEQIKFFVNGDIGMVEHYNREKKQAVYQDRGDAKTQQWKDHETENIRK